MAVDTSIVYRGIDELTGPLTTIRNSNRAFDKDLESLAKKMDGYGKRQDNLVKKISETQHALKKASDEVKAAEETYDKLNNEVNDTNLQKARDEYHKLASELKIYQQASKDTVRELSKLDEEKRRIYNRQDAAAGVEAFGSGMLDTFAQAGLTRLTGQTLAGAADAFVGSSFGSEVGTMFSSVVSLAAEGASVGATLSATGAAVGAAIGGALGLVQGATQIFEKRDGAFKDYVQEQYSTITGRSSEQIESGSGIAAQREQDAIAFDQLLGEGEGKRYLKDLRALAADTPMEYSDLTAMSRALATGFGDDPQRMLDLMTGIGNAGSAVGIDASGMGEMARAMSRMESSNKASLEYLNIFQDRGVDVIGMLGTGLGKSQSQIYTMISKGQIQGVQAVKIIQDAMDELYGGAMVKQSKTYSGLVSTLTDAETELDNASGEGYNQARGGGIQKEIDYLGGPVGTAMEEMNQMIGAGQGYADNLAEEYQRQAFGALLEGKSTTRYDDDQANRLKEMHQQYEKLAASWEHSGDEARIVLGKEMEALRAEAESMSKSAYNASEASLQVRDVELSLIAAIQDNTLAIRDSWTGRYNESQALDQGTAAPSSRAADTVDSGQVVSEAIKGSWGGRYGTSVDQSQTDGYAFGLHRVPKDDYPARLHEGERVLTASQARQLDTEGIRQTERYFTKETKEEQLLARIREDERILTTLQDQQADGVGARQTVFGMAPEPGETLTGFREDAWAVDVSQIRQTDDEGTKETTVFGLAQGPEDHPMERPREDTRAMIPSQISPTDSEGIQLPYGPGRKYPTGIQEDAQALTVPQIRQTGGEGIQQNLLRLPRVPEDDYLGRLHARERASTIAQTRQADVEAGRPPVQVTVSGNQFYGSDTDMEDRIARKIAHEVERAVMLSE